MATPKKFQCPYCKGLGNIRYYTDLSAVAEHMLQEHKYRFPACDGWSRDRIAYWLKTGRVGGKCCICGRPTDFNEKTGKYHRFCRNPRCKEEFRKVFEKRMINKYGKMRLLDDPDMQRKMLANRRISGEYIWSDRRHEFTHTGSYEKEFLKFLDINLGYEARDIFAPAPYTFYYELDGKKHFYIPDFWIISLNLLVEIKDEDNTHPNRLERDARKEKAKDEIFLGNTEHFNYVKLCGKNFKKFLYTLDLIKQKDYNGEEGNVVVL